MKNDYIMKIKTLILFLIVALSFNGCFLFKNLPKGNNNNDNDGDIMYGITMVLNGYQMDSLLIADELPTLDEWIKVGFQDYETHESIYKYTYIKDITERSELIYIATVKDTLYKVMKRMIEIKDSE